MLEGKALCGELSRFRLHGEGEVALRVRPLPFHKPEGYRPLWLEREGRTFPGTEAETAGLSCWKTLS